MLGGRAVAECPQPQAACHALGQQTPCGRATRVALLGPGQLLSPNSEQEQKAH